MIFVIYAIIAAAVTFLSVKAADYVDLIDKKTSLSGAFIGGILLSAVTSLPELFTSLSSTLLLDEPGLCLGNILGSVISATVLYVLPEAMRSLEDYRMILYAVVLILVMLFTWSPKVKEFVSVVTDRVSRIFKKKEVETNG